MIDGVSHITLSVRDLAFSFAFYTELLGLRPVAKWYNGAHLLAGDQWLCLTADVEARRAPLPEYTHLAFHTPPSTFAGTVERLRVAGIRCWQENRSPGDSFYFLDPDGHKLELHTGSLAERIAALTAAPPRGLVLSPGSSDVSAASAPDLMSSTGPDEQRHDQVNEEPQAQALVGIDEEEHKHTGQESPEEERHQAL